MQPHHQQLYDSVRAALKAPDPFSAVIALLPTPKANRDTKRELKIIAVEQGVDMRLIRSFRDRAVCRRLKPGQCIVAINTKEDIARVIDHRGAYTMYAPEGEYYNIAAIRQWMRDGCGVELNDELGFAAKVEREAARRHTRKAA